MKLEISKIERDQWFKLVCQSLTDGNITSPFGDVLPKFPNDEMQRNTTSLSGKEALVQANGFYDDISNVLELHNVRIEPDWVILDFGSCWGRISRFFLRDVPLRNIHGIDVEKAFVDTCKTLFRSNNFSICSALPPCNLRDSSVNLITAYSVFSHLSEFAFRAWLLEFHRVLSIGGVVAFTTRNELFFEYCNSLRSQGGELSGYKKALASVMPDIHDFQKRYMKGEFIFTTGRGISGGSAKDESFYGEAFIPKSYVESVLSDFFKVLDYKSVGNNYDQALFVLQKL